MVKKVKSFKQSIKRILTANKKNIYVSRIMLLKNISTDFKRLTKNRLKFYLKSCLDTMEGQKLIIRKKQSYRLSKKIFENFIKKVNKKKNTKQKNQKSPKKIKNQNTPIRKLTNQVSSANKTPKIKKTKSPSSSKSGAIINLIPNNFITQPLISLTTFKQPYFKRYKAIWQFYDPNNFNAKIKRSDGWYDYDEEASDVVEDEWQKYIVNRGMNDVRAVKSGEWEYMVDFINWKQTNIIHQNHRERPVRRIDERGEVTKNPYV